MGIKHTEAKRKYWESIPKKTRSERMRTLAKKKHAKLTKKQRSENARKIINIRWKKLSTVA